MVEFYFGDKIIAVAMPDLGIPESKLAAITLVKALIKIYEPDAVTITSEGWRRQGRTKAEALATTAKEVVHVALMNRDGTGASWMGVVRRVEGSGRVEEIVDTVYLDHPPEGGDYATLFDGNVSDDVLEEVRKEFNL